MSSLHLSVLLTPSLTVRLIEPVRNDTDQSGDCVKPVYLVGKPWGWPEVLQEAVRDVGEVDLLVTWIDRDVVERVELPAEVVVYQLYVLVNVVRTARSTSVRVVLYGGRGFIRYRAEATRSPCPSPAIKS